MRADMSGSMSGYMPFRVSGFMERWGSHEVKYLIDRHLILQQKKPMCLSGGRQPFLEGHPTN